MNRDSVLLAELTKEREKQKPEWTDQSRGILLAMIRSCQALYFPKMRLSKETVIDSLRKIAAVLKESDENYNAWTVAEQWCWLVELYCRFKIVAPKFEWRWMNSLDFLTNSDSKDQYLGCLTFKRLMELTVAYENEEAVNFLKESEKTFEQYASSSRKILDAELMFYCGETNEYTTKKKRRPPFRANNKKNQQKIAKPSPIQEFDSNGFNELMYDTLIELVKTTPDIWLNPNNADETCIDAIYGHIALNFRCQLSEHVEASKLERITGHEIKRVWNFIHKFWIGMQQTQSDKHWDWSTKLEFLSQCEPTESVDMNPETQEPSTSDAFLPLRQIKLENDSASSSRSASSTPSQSMATSSLPLLPTSNNNGKSITAILNQLVEMQKNSAGLSNTSAESSQDLMEMLNKMIGGAGDGSLGLIKTEPIDIMEPSAKKARTDSPTSSSSTPMPQPVMVLTDPRNVPLVPVSTWVPPKEDLNAKLKEEVPLTPKRTSASATAIVKTRDIPANAEKRKFQSLFLPNTSTIMPATPAVQQRVMPATIALQNPAITNILNRKVEPMMNGNGVAQHGASTPSDGIEDKWTHLGKLVTATCREIDGRSPMHGLQMFKEIQELLLRNSFASLATAFPGITSAFGVTVPQPHIQNSLDNGNNKK